VKMIQPVVEGDGEVEALPVLLRRLLDEASAPAVKIGKPIRQKRNQLASERGVNRAVEVARRKPCEAILIVFDGDRDCPPNSAPRCKDGPRPRLEPCRAKWFCRTASTRLGS